MKNEKDNHEEWVAYNTVTATFVQTATVIEKAASKIAAGNLVMQADIEKRLRLAREEHEKLVASLKELESKAGELDAAIEASTPQSSPPMMGALLLAFVAPKNTVQAFLGDLEEVFHKNSAQFGIREAKRQYWMQVFASLGPLAWQWLRRIGLVTFIIDYVRSKFGL